MYYIWISILKSFEKDVMAFAKSSSLQNVMHICMNLIYMVLQIHANM